MRVVIIVVGLMLISAACGDGTGVPPDATDQQIPTEALTDADDGVDARPVEGSLDEPDDSGLGGTDEPIVVDVESQVSEDDAEIVGPVSLGAVLRRIGEWAAKVEREGGDEVTDALDEPDNPAPEPDLPAVALNDGWPYQPKYPNTDKVVPPPRD